MKKSIIRSVPYSILPNWVKKVTDVGRPNLNPYIKDHFQDVQFLNADFHQDMTRGRKFCTFYVYLDSVKEKELLSPGFRGQSCAWSSTLSALFKKINQR